MRRTIRKPGDPRRVYRYMLRREPTDTELSATAGLSVRETAARVIDTDEYRARSAERDPSLGYLAGSAQALDLFPPGTASKDGAAISGRTGHLMLDRGGNAVIDQFQGLSPFSDAKLDAWETVVGAREREAACLEAPLAMLVAPDKLATHPDEYPGELGTGGPRPMEQLIDRVGDRLLYPVHELTAGREAEDVAPYTDSHLSLHGAQIVLSAVLARLGLDDHDVSATTPTKQGLVAGGLAGRFGGRVFDVQDVPRGDGAVAAYDNAEAILGRGSHKGVIRVARNADPVYPGKLLVFGDSYCWPNHFGLLGVLLERTFAEVQFVWMPFAWDPVLAASFRPDYVLVETAERFMVRVPQLEVDALRATSSVISRNTPPGVPRRAQTWDRR